MSTETTDSKQQINVQRFQKGVELLGKLIGIEDVKQDSGDEICKMAMVKLKAVVKAKKEPKQKLALKLTLDGVEIFDRLTNASLYKHMVNRISYISRDPTDSRAIGYIYKNSAQDLQFFAIKTQNQASELFNALKDLFETVLEMKKLGSETASGSNPAVTGSNAQKQSAIEQESSVKKEEPKSLLDVSETTTEKPAPALISDTPVNTPSSSLPHDIFQLEKSFSQTLDKSTELTKSSSSDLLGVFTADPRRSAGANVNMFDRYSGLNTMPAFALAQAPQLRPQLPPNPAFFQNQGQNPFQSPLSAPIQQTSQSPFFNSAPALVTGALGYGAQFAPPRQASMPSTSQPVSMQPPLPPMQSNLKEKAPLSASPFANLVTPDLFAPNPNPTPAKNNDVQLPW